MAESTGPILAAGALVAGNAIIVNNRDPRSQTPVVVATLVVAAGLALAERPFPAAAVAFAWVTLMTVILVRVDPNTPSPAESFANWYEGTRR